MWTDIDIMYICRFFQPGSRFSSELIIEIFTKCYLIHAAIRSDKLKKRLLLNGIYNEEPTVSNIKHIRVWEKQGEIIDIYIYILSLGEDVPVLNLPKSFYAP